jgi:hypothetical protein
MHGHEFVEAVGLGAAAMALNKSLRAEPMPKRPPNFVVIFTDDRGYADVGCCGAKGFETPDLDRMAREELGDGKRKGKGVRPPGKVG